MNCHQRYSLLEVARQAENHVRFGQRTAGRSRRHGQTLLVVGGASGAMLTEDALGDEAQVKVLVNVLQDWRMRGESVMLAGMAQPARRPFRPQPISTWPSCRIG